MRTIRAGLAAVAVLGLAVTACGGGGGGNRNGKDEPDTTSTTTSTDSVFNVTLSGDEEAPDPGDDEGTGFAEIRIDPDGSEICYTLSVSELDGVTAAHIHEGRSGTAGPIAVTLEAPVTGQSEGCVATSSSIIDGLTSGTRAFYVNVHTNDFPDGAVRAQLTG